MNPSPLLSAEQRPHPSEREAEGGAARGAKAVGEGKDGEQRAVVARRRGEGQPRPGGRRGRALRGAAHHETEEPGTRSFNLFPNFGRKLEADLLDLV